MSALREDQQRRLLEAQLDATLIEELDRSKVRIMNLILLFYHKLIYIYHYNAYGMDTVVYVDRSAGSWYGRGVPGHSNGQAD